MDKKVCVLHSGGQDSLACMLEAIEKYGAENIISLGIKYGQKHFEQENAAAWRFCNSYDPPISRFIISVFVLDYKDSSLTNANVDIPTEMADQRKTVVPFRNTLFLIYAAAFAQEHDCDRIILGPCKEDFENYRDCRPDYFEIMQMVIQAGLTKPTKGSEQIKDDFVVEVNPFGAHQFVPEEKLDIVIETPLINETKEETLKRILLKHPVSIYKYTYTCYKGGLKSCGKCPACQERLAAFKDCGVEDPIEYEK